MIKGLIPELPAAVYLGYASAVNGDATLSCPSTPNFSTGDFGRPWRCLPCSSALGFYIDDTGLPIPLSASLSPPHLQSSSYLPSPQELPRCRRRLRRPGQSRADIPTKKLERTRYASRKATTGYISPNRQTPTGYPVTIGYRGLEFFLSVGQMMVCALLHDFGAQVSRVLGFKYWEFLVECVGGVVYDNIT